MRIICLGFFNQNKLRDEAFEALRLTKAILPLDWKPLGLVFLMSYDYLAMRVSFIAISYTTESRHFFKRPLPIDLTTMLHIKKPNFHFPRLNWTKRYYK